MNRRKINGYEWRNELDKLDRLGEQMASDALELSREASSVNTIRTLMRLLDNSRQVSVKALELKGYKNAEPQP